MIKASRNPQERNDMIQPPHGLLKGYGEFFLDDPVPQLHDDVIPAFDLFEPRPDLLGIFDL